jgi:hypothetical protein
MCAHERTCASIKDHLRQQKTTVDYEKMQINAEKFRNYKIHSLSNNRSA